MWDTVSMNELHLSPDPQCPRCGQHSPHLPRVQRHLRLPSDGHAGHRRLCRLRDNSRSAGASLCRR